MINKDFRRKIFYVVATGGHNTDQHYFDTIKNKHTAKELQHFLSPLEREELERYTLGHPFAVWGAVPGERNLPRWETMEQGDYVMIYRSGKVIAAAEVALKTRNKELARHFWKEDAVGNTWELIFFLTNVVEVNVEQSALNEYLSYGQGYFPRGFMSLAQEKADHLLGSYGDLLSLLQKLEKGYKLEEVDFEKKKIFQEFTEERISRAPTEHDEMQWRLISLGNKAKFDVWVPANDQGRSYQGNIFREHVIREFREALDVPSYVKNIDTIWKLGLSIKAAFEIENSTSIYSGILRLSDLRALAPNSSYPLYIVADRARRSKVFDQLRRPTFSNDYLQLDRVIKFLSYDAIRDLDSGIKLNEEGFEISYIDNAAEAVS